MNSLISPRLQPSEPDHYATLGLDRRCTPAQIRDAYRLLAKRFHPDVNQTSADAMARTQELNAAYEILSDVERREDYDRERETQRKSATPRSKIDRNISEDVNLQIEEFLRGTTLDVRVNDPANPNGPETYQLTVPPETAPGTRFRLPREEPFVGGFVLVRLKVLPGFRFKTRGADLRCDLRIKAERAAQGGTEMVVGATGQRLHVQIPKGVGRGEVIRLANEGLPKPRGGRGDLLVRIVYRPEVRITRTSGR
ncbi:MAG: chaperone DnaJ domain protein [Verrucomicrobiales bacterium]|nr:chaperone DnaJ domain protein [Verrucomicrobiales bacterium]